MALSAINPDSTTATVVLSWTTTPFDFALAAGIRSESDGRARCRGPDESSTNSQLGDAGMRDSLGLNGERHEGGGRAERTRFFRRRHDG
jgi:hypothetical protein